MGLRGEWWIDGSGQTTFADGDMGYVSHEQVAWEAALGINWDEELVTPTQRNAFLKKAEQALLDPEVKNLFREYVTVTPNEILLDTLHLSVGNPGLLEATQVLGLKILGVNESAIEYFSSFARAKDARTYQMLYNNWIRVTGNIFQLGVLDDDALKRIGDFVYDQYEEAGENPLEDTFEIEEVKKGGMHLSLSGADLLESGKSAAALKYSARRERPEWHNPHKLGTVWAAKAKIKIQDDSVFPPRWKTLAECMDTPNAIAACIERHNLRGDLWVFGAASGRQYLGRR